MELPNTFFAERELKYEDRATWGTCPICSAVPGDWCHAELGFHLGQKADGSKMKTGEGAHLARLQGAPFCVTLEKIR